MMKRILKKRIVIPVALVAVLFTGTSFKGDFFEIAKQIEIFTTLFKELNMNYVDDTNPADLMDTAIKSMLEDLDPYTRYFNEQDVEEARIRRTGDYTGIGARIRTQKDKLIVVEPYKGYPADKAGLKAGDEIVKVDNIAIKDIDEDASELLKGEANSTLNVTYMRQGVTKTATITRSEVEIDAVPYFSMINDKTGYIVLQKFNRKTTSQTKYALKDLKAQGAERIILDLRGNPGGLLREAVKVVNLFVPKDQLVVTTKSKVKKYNKTYYTQNDPVDLEIPLVVLINGRSASASEIVSGGLQDLDRAVIVGAKSFGKGLVQRPKKLTYGTQLKVTISRYYTPSGRCIQALDYWNRDEEGNATTTKDRKEFKTKNGRIVFDGGGIEPDETVAQGKISPVIESLLGDMILFDFATEYYYNHKFEDINTFKLSETDFQDFKNYLSTKDLSFETKTEKEFEKAFKTAKKEEISEDIKAQYNNLISAIKASKIKEVDDNKAQIMQLLTDEIVKRYAYREGLFEYYETNDAMIKTAESILENPKKYKAFLK